MSSSRLSAWEAYPIGDKLAVVFEFGRAFTRCGFVNEHAPRIILRSNCLKRNDNLFEIEDEGDLYDALQLFIEPLYFKYLAVNPKDRKVIIVESIFAPTKFRQTLAKVLINYFEVPGIVFVPNHLMTMMTLMCSTGIVVDVGYTECCVTPVIEGITLVDSIHFRDLGGKAIHDRIQSHLIKHKATISYNGMPFSFDETEIQELTELEIEDIKVRTCFIPSFSRGQELIKARIEKTAVQGSPKDVLYPLEGRKALTIPGIIRESSAQVLFEAEGNEATISSLILDVIERCPVDSRKSLASNIILTGGTSLMTGFRRRIKQELENLVRVRNLPLDSSSLKFHSLPCPANYSSWLGGAIYGSTEATSTRLITKKQLESPKGLLTTDWNLWTPN